MGILSGGLSVRRYRVAGAAPDDFRVVFRDVLNDHAFREPREWVPGVQVVGWCQLHNLLDTDFGDLNRWLYDDYIVAALRIDKKSLPSKLLKAHLDKRVAAWCQENQRPKAPAQIKADIKEQLERQMLDQILPRVATHEFCWNLTDGHVLFHNCSDKVNDEFRKVFRHTFGLSLLPWSPLDFLTDDPATAAALEIQGLSDLRGEAGVAMLQHQVTR
ncbi:MAG: recombination-associated protein RdgC [Oligoflexia bacterium]|nr:recombination-associated protein RdgC [Oligoflexia bacterium]